MTVHTWKAPVIEAAIAFLTAALVVASSIFIHVNPLDRIGQVSGLAALELRFTAVAIGLVTALVIAARWRGGAKFDPTSRWVCAAIAGLTTGLVGGGVLVALRGTPWGINGQGGDVGRLSVWATMLHKGFGEYTPQTYPPIPLHILHLYSDLVHMGPGHALKHLEIAGVAAFGPIVYLSWRMLLRPVWALAIGVVVSLPLIEPYKPYPNLVLAVFVPIAILYVQAIRRSASWPMPRVLRAGVIYGLVFGVLALFYSGWFQWAAPGLLVATLVVFPWRARKHGLFLLALTGAMFVLFTRNYILAVLTEPPIRDNYIYFDVRTDPMYIAIWRNDTPGELGVWPPIGELGGVGLYTILLTAGTGLAIALRRHTTVAITLGAMMAGAWLMRFKIAQHVWETKLVQLYPRTTPLILYCLLLLCGYAVYWLIQRARATSWLHSPSAMIGAICGLLLFFASAGSALADHYMPVRNSDPPAAGSLTWNAHMSKRGERAIVSRPMPWIRRVAP